MTCRVDISTMPDAWNIWSEIHFQARMEINKMTVAETSPEYDIEPEDVYIYDSVTTIGVIK